MNPRLPALYNELEPIAWRIAERAAALEPIDEQRAYLVSTSRQIVEQHAYRTDAAANGAADELAATLGWFDLLDDELEAYVTGERSPQDLIRRAGGRMWVEFQAREPVCAAWAHGVAAAIRPRLAGNRVLELGAGSGGTTLLLAEDLRACGEFVISDVRQSFLDRLVKDLPGVPVKTALVDIDAPDPSVGTFDLIFATNCLHVSKDVPTALARLRALLRPGGSIVLGEGSHYSADLPSPLSLVLALFDGWWDAPTSPKRPVPGFLLAEQWLAALADAGYSDPCCEQWSDAGRRFGGVIWATQPG